MPRCFESAISRRGSRDRAGASLTREFFVTDQADPAAADALIDVTAETTFLGLDRKRWEREEIVVGHWRYTVTYGSSANGQAGLRPDQLNFRLGTATRHITQSLQTLYRVIPGESAPASGIGARTNAFTATQVDAAPDGYTTTLADVGQSLVVTGGTGWTVGSYLITGLVGGVAGGDWVLDRAPAAANTAGGVWHLSGKGPDSKGAIGQSLDAVQGADVEYPVLEFSLAARVQTMTFARLRELRALVRTTNRAAWNGFAAGELLYLGCEPTSPEGTLEVAAPLAFWQLAHHFRYEPNQTNVRVGDCVVPFVGGHEYVWARYGGEVSGLMALAYRAFVQRPAAVYVERVYESSDFTALGITL